MECQTLFQGLIHLILTYRPSQEVLSPHYTTLTNCATSLRQRLKSLAERYNCLFNFRQPPITLFHYLTIIAYICLGEEDLQSNPSTRQLFTICFNAIHDTTETVFLANTVLHPLEVAAHKQIGATWSPSESRKISDAERESQLSMIIERTYSAYPSNLSHPDINAARADLILRSMVELSLEKVNPSTGASSS